MNLNLTADPMADLLNREIARRESLPPFVNNNAIPMAFLDVKDGVARVCCYHAESIEDQRLQVGPATTRSSSGNWWPDLFLRKGSREEIDRAMARGTSK